MDGLQNTQRLAATAVAARGYVPPKHVTTNSVAAAYLGKPTGVVNPRRHTFYGPHVS